MITFETRRVDRWAKNVGFAWPQTEGWDPYKALRGQLRRGALTWPVGTLVGVIDHRGSDALSCP